MAVELLTFAGLAVVIIVAGTILANCADAIADATGLGRLLVGSVLLAGATSLPELTVDITSVRLGLADLAMGDLIGSSLANLLILAILDLSRYSRGKMLSKTAAAHALGGLFSIALTALVGLGILAARNFADWTFLGVHVWTWLVAAAYVLGVRMVYLDQRIAARTVADESAAGDKGEHRVSLGRSIAVFAGAAAAILLAGPFLAASAGRIAEQSGLGNTFVGTTLVALSTSLPELAASYGALRLGAIDMAVGNLFGSNAFNMLLFVPLDFLSTDSMFVVANPLHAVSAFAVVIASSVVIIGQLYRVERRIPLLEPDALLVILVILGALAIVYSTSQT